MSGMDYAWLLLQMLPVLSTRPSRNRVKGSFVLEIPFETDKTLGAQLGLSAGPLQPRRFS